MGASSSSSNIIPTNNLCNYHCPMCQQTGKTPNIAGRFFILDEEFCQCNACKTVFEKKQFYKDVSDPIPKVVEGVVLDK